MYIKHLMSLCLCVVLTLSGCRSVRTDSASYLSEADAKKELSSLLTKVSVSTVSDPIMDIYSDDSSEYVDLADIDIFPIVVDGHGDINIEIAAATELSSSAPDDWLNEVAERFNRESIEYNGRSVGVSVRKITSGEAVTYILNDRYKPTAFIPSNDAWGKMLDASGYSIVKQRDRIAGNTAGILIKKDVYDNFISKYKEVTVQNILSAANAGDISFAYTNPYTSSTGLNVLSSMMASFDSNDPLSDAAVKALNDYQKTSPPVAYTTAVLRNQASKGIINAMVMEEQAYINTSELKNYVYTPIGIRHDHPVYSFDWDTKEEIGALNLFIDYCLNDTNQKSASSKGFNRHDDYVAENDDLTGSDYLAIQKVWKQNKNGGRPVVAVFVTDVSGSMNGEPLNSLKSSLISSSAYIGTEQHVGLVSYSDNVTVNLPIAPFDPAQRAYFTGEVKNLNATGGTATYDALLVAVDMLLKYSEDMPDAKLMLFLLTDGQQNKGYGYRRIEGVIGGLKIPVYTIAYNYNNTGELTQLSNINEAAQINADSDDVSNALRNLFNVNL